MQKVLSLSFVLLFALAACQVQPPPPQTSDASVSTNTNYVLGVVQPFTGSLGAFGTDFQRGIELAVEQMNAELAAAGSPIHFTTASADSENTPDGAAKAVQTVVQTSGAQVIVGPLTTGEVLGAKQFADDNNIVLVAPASSGPAGGIPGDYIFRVMYPPDTFAGQAFSQIAKARGYENVVVLHVDDPFGNGMASVFESNFGGNVVSVGYAPEPTDLSSEVSKVSSEIAAMGADDSTAFFCICFLGDGQKVLQLALTDANLKAVDWMGVENLATPDILADPAHADLLAAANFVSVSFAESSTPNTQPFVDDFTAKYGQAPGPFTNYAYDAANVAMLSMLAAGNNGKAVKSMLPFIANHYIGTAVQTYLDENGDQAVVNYGVYTVNADKSGFEQVGSYDGATGQVTFE
ncbi:MAG: ABC transporter substrate-binding protein [Caldilineaceae bacterium]|nr:ABC transporter substrate-binding protein [Caldilineaceae bacterium]